MPLKMAAAAEEEGEARGEGTGSLGAGLGAESRIGGGSFAGCRARDSGVRELSGSGIAKGIWAGEKESRRDGLALRRKL